MLTTNSATFGLSVNNLCACVSFNLANDQSDQMPIYRKTIDISPLEIKLQLASVSLISRCACKFAPC